MGFYINYNATDLHMQKVTENSDFVGVTLRKRDGYNDSIIGKKGVHFYCPPHVQTTPSKIDKEFVTSLFNASKSDAWKSYEEAIFSYNLANTDSLSIMEQKELVLLCGAFERALLPKSNPDRSYDAEGFSKDFQEIFTHFPENKTVLDSSRSITRGSIKKCLRKAWSWDFYTSRNELGHGKYKVGEHKQTRWDIKEHLLLATYILPLVIKIKLSNNNKYKLSEGDKNAIHAMDCILAKPDLFIRNENTELYHWQDGIVESKFKIKTEETEKAFQDYQKI